MKLTKKLISGIMAVCLACSMGGAFAVFAADEPAVSETISLSNATFRGKYFTKTVSSQTAYTFTYGSSGFSVNFTGTEFWMYVPTAPEQDSSIRNVNVAVLVDTDMPMDATMVGINKTGWICLASGLENGSHSITVRKQSRAFYGIMASDWFCVSKIGTSADGSFGTPDALSDFVIEVYGDSITNGDAVWLNESGDNEGYTYGNYTGVLERLLDAEVKVCGNTGNGLLGWVMAGDANGKLDNLLPPQNSWNVIDPHQKNDAYSHEGANAADVVIINLGTNDRGERGNGDLTNDQFHDEYLRFVKQIKRDCPDAIVIGIIGAMGGISEWGDTIQQVAANANDWNGEDFCYYFQLQQCNAIEGGPGYDNGHPSNLAHEIYGLQLATMINEILDLGKTLPTDIPDIYSDYVKEQINIAGTATASDSGQPMYNNTMFADNLNDGNNSSEWQFADDVTLSADTYCQLEFDSAVEINSVHIRWEGDTRAKKNTSDGYYVQYSTDGSAWSDFPNVNYAYNDDTYVDVITFSKTSLKYLRVTLLGGKSSKNNPKIYELYTYADNPDSINDPNIMNFVTAKSDNLTRAIAAAHLENITVSAYNTSFKETQVYASVNDDSSRNYLFVGNIHSSDITSERVIGVGIEYYLVNAAGKKTDVKTLVGNTVFASVILSDDTITVDSLTGEADNASAVFACKLTDVPDGDKLYYRFVVKYQRPGYDSQYTLAKSDYVMLDKNTHL